ncbi:MAG: L-fucose/L-arabinose isomerase family protein [Phycisphaerales bacterium]|jgi:L-fucose isomerase-like protein|nr:L-fucose/L-arabinose isomerase family protein [Phycisphaerales bacterium]
MATPKRPTRIGFIPAHRGFFSASLAAEARRQTISLMRELGVEVIVPSETQTEHGCVQDIRQAEVCADLFRSADVDGIVIGAMNFGDEQAVAHVVKSANLDVPIFLFGAQESQTLSLKMDRRDAFCGLLSIADALRQIGARYLVGRRPICSPAKDASFRTDLDEFFRACRVVKGIRRARYGQLGARPDAFWTCRFDERRLQRLGPTTVVLDLSEAIAGIGRMKDDEADVLRMVRELTEYADCSSAPSASLVMIAKFELFLKRWIAEQALDGVAIQCWTSMQQNLGISSCAAMSRLSDQGFPAACEADILGTLSMHALHLASDNPAALADWNNLHNEDDELVNLWHCGVFPRSFASEKPRLTAHGILKSLPIIGEANSFGTIEFEAKPGPVTLLRIAQDNADATKALVVEGQFEENSAHTFGSYGWCRIHRLQQLYRDVLLQHFPHHVAVVQSHVANPLKNALGKFLGIQVFSDVNSGLSEIGRT